MYAKRDGNGPPAIIFSDLDGTLLDHEDVDEASYITRLTVRPDQLEGISPEAAQQVMTGQGRTISDCFKDAWNRDLSLSGAVIWTSRSREA